MGAGGRGSLKTLCPASSNDVVLQDVPAQKRRFASSSPRHVQHPFWTCTQVNRNTTPGPCSDHRGREPSPENTLASGQIRKRPGWWKQTVQGSSGKTSLTSGLCDPRGTLPSADDRQRLPGLGTGEPWPVPSPHFVKDHRKFLSNPQKAKPREKSVIPTE